jgi:subtilisin family serine protease
MDGTSFAVPFVAASAALLRQYHPELSAAEVATRLIATADPAPSGHRGGEYGAGVLNPYRALTDRIGGPPKVLPPVGAAPRDPNADASARRAAQTRARSLGMAVGGLLLAGLVLLVAVTVPRGRRRGWRPGARPVPVPVEEPPDDDNNAAALAQPTRGPRTQRY